jgi:hypothetical protein
VLLRDARGDLVQGFYRKLGPSNSQCAEMRSLVHAMHIVRQLQLELDQVIFEIDSSIVATVVLTRATCISYLKYLLEEVIYLLTSLIGLLQFNTVFMRLNG